jgi:hypothetical protein
MKDRGILVCFVENWKIRWFFFGNIGYVLCKFKNFIERFFFRE